MWKYFGWIDKQLFRKSDNDITQTNVKKSFKLTYGLSSHDYRVASYLTFKGISIQSLKSIGNLYHA